MTKRWFSLCRAHLDEPKPILRPLTQESQTLSAQLKFVDQVECQ